MKAWKSYTLTLLLLKCLFARASEALSQQQPAFRDVFMGLQMHPEGTPADAIEAAEAAGIQGAAARNAAAHTACKMLSQVTSLDEAAAAIFGRFVSKTHFP